MICKQITECADAQFAGKHIKKCTNARVTCVESSDCHTNVKCEERGKKYILENTRKERLFPIKWMAESLYWIKLFLKRYLNVIICF